MQLRAIFTWTALAVSGVFAAAQQSDMGTRSSASQTQSVSAAKPEMEQRLTGRLPRYYSSVVTPQQRQEIYRIQTEYREQLELLQKQIEQIRSQQTEAVARVLSDDQRTQVEALRQAAKERRVSTRVTQTQQFAQSAEPESTPRVNSKDSK